MKARGLLIGLIVLGLGLVAAPAIFQMWSRAPKGAVMLDEFRPYMTEQRIASFQGYMRQIDRAVAETDGELRPYLAQNAGIDDATFRERFAEFDDFTSKWPAIDTDMSDMLTKVHANIDDYEAVDALPSFDLFPWFFVVPGLLIAGLAGFALWRPGFGTASLWVVVVLGIGLVAAPFAFQMFSRAPKGGEMMDDFTRIESRSRVQAMQGYFSTMAVGEGSIRLGIIPALRQEAGLTDAQIADEFPAVSKLRDNWVTIINEMTPMIGAMSDNVDNYQAIKALPPFPLFPIFFVVPGAIAAVLAGIGLRRERWKPTPENDDVRAPSAAATAEVPEHEGAPAMSARHPFRAGVASLALALAVAGTSGVAAAAPAKDKPKKLVGTFELTAGTCDASGVPSGSYFRMVTSPTGSITQGPFFPDPDSTCSDKSYIPAEPGADGGLITGKYQPQPDPPFDSVGNALADDIIQPQGFTAINFSVSTNPTEPQTGEKVPKPTITVKGKKLSGDLRAITASWNKEQFSQGSPKPDGSKPGLTKAVTGTYAAKTGEFTLEWASQIVGGPFNDFTGVWHWEGTFTKK